MNNHDIEPDPELTDEQCALVNELNSDEIEKIDKALLANTSKYWRKVARVVAATMTELPERALEIPDIYFAGRVKELVKKGILESQGNLAYMRYSEVRLPLEETMINET